MGVQIAYLKDYPEFTAALGCWEFEAWGEYDPQSTIKAEIGKYKQHCQIGALPLTLVALNEDYHLLGMCSLRITDDVRLDLAPWLGSLYVALRHRNKKIGEQLMNATKRIAKSMDYDHLYLFTFDASLNNYCAKLGWELMGKDQLKGHTVSVMEIKLN